MNENEKPLHQRIFARLGLKPKRQTEIPIQVEAAQQKNILSVSIPEGVNRIQFADLSLEDQQVVREYLPKLPKTCSVMIERETGKLENVLHYTKAQIEACWTHGDAYPADDTLKNLAKRYVGIDFPRRNA